MKVSTKRLTTQHDRIVPEISNGNEVTMVRNGKNFTQIVPIEQDETEDDAFEMWKDREDTKDVYQYVRKMRGG